jgi:hypothetical protein
MGLFLSRSQFSSSVFLFIFSAQATGIFPSVDSPQEAGMAIQLDARDFVTIKGGTRQRSRPMPQYNLVFGSLLRDPP